MKLADHADCTGCGACLKVCPKGAIAFNKDNEGFPVPIIYDNNCIKCGLCERVCPVLNKPMTNRIRSAYAVQLLDKDTLAISTSGAVFSALAREIFKRKGIVYGCIWDKKYNAVVCKAENEEELMPMHGSKYVWSWAGDTFPEIKAYLNEGRTILFTGMPCQAAGLKGYLGKDYQNLYITTFLCGGAPSPLAFHEYLKTITKDVPYESLDFKFRDKEKYGVGINISYKGKTKTVRQNFVTNSYFYIYQTKVCHRLSCFHCAYRYEDRIDDLTFGDYWGVGKYHSEFNVREGVSAVFVNSEKGEALFDAIKDQIQVSETMIEDIAERNSLTLGEKRVAFTPPACREGFFQYLISEGWTAAERKYLYNSKRFKLWIRTLVPARIKVCIRKFMKI